MAHGIFAHKIKARKLDWEVDSAGTSGWHDGEPPDHRAIAASRKKGIDISKQVSRKVKLQDFEYYDLILAMDVYNYSDLMHMCSTDSQRKKVHLMLNFPPPGKNAQVPDPYYDGRFDEVFDMLDRATDQFIQYHSTAT
jgi:protein-tyrosine phosphatase